MSISLVTRAGNGAPLTANQFDSNMNIIQTQVNLDSAAIVILQGTAITATSLGTYFEGVSGGKQQVDWARVVNKPAELTQRYCFKAVPSGADQTITSSGSLGVLLDSAIFNTGSGFNTGTHRFTAAVAGYYQLNFSAQVQLVSGSPTAVSIIAYATVNGSHMINATLDNTGTGTRIYRGSSLEHLNVSDTVDLNVDFTYSGTATWSISGSGNPNTSLSGFLVMPT